MNHVLGEPATEAILAQNAEAIRALGKRVIGDIIEIGRLLTEAKKIAGHGNWLPWIEREFGWSRQTADNFINVFEFEASGKVPNFGNLNLPVSGLYMLAAPSTPEEAREVVIARAESGERLSVKDVRNQIAANKNRREKTAKTTTIAADAPGLAPQQIDLEDCIAEHNDAVQQVLDAIAKLNDHQLAELKAALQQRWSGGLGARVENVSGLMPHIPSFLKRT